MASVTGFICVVAFTCLIVVGFTQGSQHFPRVPVPIIAAVAALLDLGAWFAAAQHQFPHVQWFYVATCLPVAWALAMKVRHQRRMRRVAAAVQLVGMGRFHDARIILDKTIEQLLVSDGPYARTTLQVRNHFADVCELDGNHLAAIAAYQESVADADAIIGRADPATVQARERLIGLLIDSGRTAEAVAALTKQLGVHTETLGAQHPTTVATRARLATQHALFPPPHPAAPGEPDNWFQRCDHADKQAAAGMSDTALAAYDRIQHDQTVRAGAGDLSVLAIRRRFIGALRIGAARPHELQIMSTALLDMADSHQAALDADFAKLR